MYYWFYYIYQLSFEIFFEDKEKVFKKEFSSGVIILYDITDTRMEGESENSWIVQRGKGKRGKRGYTEVAIGILINPEGCSLGVESFKGLYKYSSIK